MKLTKIVFAFFLLSTFCFMSTASAANYIFEANFDGLQVVPPNASPAFGFGQFTFDDVTGNFSVTTGTYQDLLGGANSVALFNGAAGTNGPLLFSLTLDTPGAATGTYSGGGTVTAPNIAGILAGNGYVRITSSVFPSGEIRGQLFAVPEPSSVILVGMGFVGVGILRRRKKSSKD